MTENDEHIEKPSIEVLRSGMSNFIGQSIELMPFEGKDRNALVAAMLIEETLKVSRLKADSPCDLKVLQPLFKAVKVVLEQQIKIMSNKNITSEEKQIAFDYAEIILLVEKYFLK